MDKVIDLFEESMLILSESKTAAWDEYMMDTNPSSRRLKRIIYERIGDLLDRLRVNDEQFRNDVKEIKRL